MKKIMKLFVAVSVICFMMASVTGCGKKNTENETGEKLLSMKPSQQRKLKKLRKPNPLNRKQSRLLKKQNRM